jgi:toxin-antitoxin system PIN domain toxin
MILDANILLHARNVSDPHHDPARRWLESALNGDTRVGLPWSTLGAFLRIATNPRAFPDPLAPGAAWQQIEEWLNAPRAWVPEPTSRYRTVLGRLVGDHQVRGPLITDAQLAALAIDHGVALVSTDADFARFTEVRWLNPLE